MAKKVRLSPNQLAKLKADFAGLRGIGDYAPQKSEFAVTAIQPIEDEIDQLLGQEAQMLADLDALRDKIAEKGTAFSQKMKGAAQQIIGQYGDDSPEIQAVGRKRSSERAPRKPKKPAPVG